MELEGFLAEVESGHFGVEVLELCPEPHWDPHLPLKCLALVDSAGVSEAVALCGDCLVTSGSLACQYDGAGGMEISPWNAGR